MGMLYQRGRIWWVKYYVNGAPPRRGGGGEVWGGENPAKGAPGGGGGGGGRERPSRHGWTGSATRRRPRICGSITGPAGTATWRKRRDGSSTWTPSSPDTGSPPSARRT